MDERECRRILEVPEDASMEDITQAYHLMKRIYGKEQAIFSAPSMDEFSPKVREEILEEIEAAYRQLSRIHAEAQPQIHPVSRSVPVKELPVDGAGLRCFREAMGVSLEYVASQTHVRVDYLSALEDERFSDLPLATVYVRGFLSSYITELGLPVDHIVPLYMQRFQQWQTRRVK